MKRRAKPPSRSWNERKGLKRDVGTGVTGVSALLVQALRAGL